MPVLHGYFRSSAAYRVRIALNLKQMTVRHVAVHLNRNGGEQFGAPFLALNPQSLVPVFSDGVVTISQSLAIMEYLDEIQPAPPLLPEGAAARARCGRGAGGGRPGWGGLRACARARARHSAHAVWARRRLRPEGATRDAPVSKV